ncbi:MAG TPA: hypothetical protein VJZ00_02585 [Thermoanaerobaculia bacterium]|nr:hypothetical protein [Thermoanaerobaculia bacterium]
MRRAFLVMVFLARAAHACSCAGEMPQTFLGRAQFAARVIVRERQVFEVTELVRGTHVQLGRAIHVENRIEVEPTSCCDQERKEIVAGDEYWLISPEQPQSHGRGYHLDRAGLLKSRDQRIDTLRKITKVTPAALREILLKWQSGGYTPHEFTTFITTVDMANIGDCLRPYYHRLLMDVTYIAWGNEDHASCEEEESKRARSAAAADALATLSYIENAARHATLPCVRNVLDVTALPDLVEQHTKRTRFLYPCVEKRAGRTRS